MTKLHEWQAFARALGLRGWFDRKSLVGRRIGRPQNEQGGKIENQETQKKESFG